MTSVDDQKNNIDGEPPEAPGGKGEVLSDPRHTRADARLAARALRERWAIPDGVRESIAARAARFAEEADNCRDFIPVARVLVEIDKLNLKQQEIDAKAEGDDDSDGPTRVRTPVEGPSNADT